MSLTVKNLIERYSELEQIKESKTRYKNLFDTDVVLEGDLAIFSEEETRVLAALNLGVVTESILKKRREARSF